MNCLPLNPFTNKAMAFMTAKIKPLQELSTFTSLTWPIMRLGIALPISLAAVSSES
jgi:hypothetical protein